LHAGLLRCDAHARRAARAPPRSAFRAAADPVARGIRNFGMKNVMSIALALALAACSSGPDYARPATASAAAGSFVAANSPGVEPLAPVPDNWWRLYNDPVLDGLIADALAHNTDVRAAVARLARARASLKEVKVDRLPQGGVSASATRGRENGESDT